MTNEEALQFLDCYDTLWSQFEEPTRTRARDAVEVAHSALRERIERDNGWISVKDRLPEYEEDAPHYGLCSPKVLAAYGVHDKRIIIAAHRIDGWIEWYSNELISRQELVTHWMPLPQPPKEDKP